MEDGCLTTGGWVVWVLGEEAVHIEVLAGLDREGGKWEGEFPQIPRPYQLKDIIMR